MEVSVLSHSPSLLGLIMIISVHRYLCREYQIAEHHRAIRAVASGLIESCRSVGKWICAHLARLVLLPPPPVDNVTRQNRTTLDQNKIHVREFVNGARISARPAWELGEKQESVTKRKTVTVLD